MGVDKNQSQVEASDKEEAYVSDENQEEDSMEQIEYSHSNLADNLSSHYS